MHDAVKHRGDRQDLGPSKEDVLLPMSDSDSDLVNVLTLVTDERQARDRGWWSSLARCYTPEATVRTSRFDGTAVEYIEFSRCGALSAAVKPTSSRTYPEGAEQSEVDARWAAEACGSVSSRATC